VVVGAGPGLGAAIAHRFAAGGLAVGLIARRPDMLRVLAEELDGETATAAADAGDAAALATAIQEVTARLGDPVVLVYNAAALQSDRPDELTPADFDARFRVNVGGAFVAARAVYERMRGRGHGTIIFTGGGLGVHPSASYTSLSVGKAAIRALALALHDAWAPDGVHVATVTIEGFIRPATHFAPEAIAEAYWALHAQPAGSWDAELAYNLLRRSRRAA
jgi:NADP-dependent 3-hydroxy acid dehydrogenase YdfG